MFPSLHPGLLSAGSPGSPATVRGRPADLAVRTWNASPVPTCRSQALHPGWPPFHWTPTKNACRQAVVSERNDLHRTGGNDLQQYVSQRGQDEVGNRGAPTAGTGGARLVARAWRQPIGKLVLALSIITPACEGTSRRARPKASRELPASMRLLVRRAQEYSMDFSRGQVCGSIPAIPRRRVLHRAWEALAAPASIHRARSTGSPPSRPHTRRRDRTAAPSDHWRRRRPARIGGNREGPRCAAAGGRGPGSASRCADPGHKQGPGRLPAQGPARADGHHLRLERLSDNHRAAISESRTPRGLRSEAVSRRSIRPADSRPPSSPCACERCWWR